MFEKLKENNMQFLYDPKYSVPKWWPIFDFYPVHWPLIISQLLNLNWSPSAGPNQEPEMEIEPGPGT